VPGAIGEISPPAKFGEAISTIPGRTTGATDRLDNLVTRNFVVQLAGLGGFSTGMTGVTLKIIAHAGPTA